MGSCFGSFGDAFGWLKAGGMGCFQQSWSTSVPSNNVLQTLFDPLPIFIRNCIFKCINY